MASRSLGTLTLDLVARIGGFTQGMTEAERVADQKTREMARKQRARAKEVEKAWQGATKFIGTAFAGLTVAGLFRSFVQESVAAQNEQAQLAAVIRSTGQAAGFTAGELNKMADELSGRSTFSAGEINQAQTRLLSYTGIVGEQFPKAMQAVIDMAARMGMSIEQSAETIGRALDIPSQGLTALQRQGFRFTEEQKKAVEQLEKTGRVAEAQAVVLEALESSYGGAAQAARDTFGGAIAALQNEIRTLMTGSDGSLEGARQAIEGLTDTMRSPATKQGFEQMINGLASITSYTVQAISEFGVFADVIAREMARATTGLTKLDDLKGSLNDLDRALNNSFLFKPIKYLTTNRQELERMRDAVLAQIAAIEGASGGRASSSGATSPDAAEMARLAAEQKLRAERDASVKASIRQTQSYLENLRKQLQATESLTVAETVLRDIREGRFTGGKASQNAALELAKQIDAAREMEKVQKEQVRLAEYYIEQIEAENKAIFDQSAAWKTAERELLDMVEPVNALVRKLAELDKLDGFVDPEILAAARLEINAQIDSMNGLKKEVEEFDTFAKTAAENFQSAFADFLFDPFDKGIKGMLEGFIQMINRMVAEAIAADIARRLFGDNVKGGTGSGLFGELLGAIGGLFGGARAAGGPVMANIPYLVGEDGPEIVVPGKTGYVIPNDLIGAAPGRAGVQQYNTFAFSDPVSTKTQTQMAARLSFEQRRASRLM